MLVFGGPCDSPLKLHAEQDPETGRGCDAGVAVSQPQHPLLQWENYGHFSIQEKPEHERNTTPNL